MKKIAIIGSGGSGKSTLAIKLSNKLKIDVYHLDALLWKPNWIGVTREEQIIIQNELIKKDEWIIDGNYSGTIDLRLSAADTIIFLDIPRLICTFRVIKRFFKYRNKTRPDMVEGCKEKIDFNFIKWVWKFPKDKRPNLMKKIEKLLNGKEVIILKSLKEVRLFLNDDTLS